MRPNSYDNELLSEVRDRPRPIGATPHQFRMTVLGLIALALMAIRLAEFAGSW